MSAAERLYDDVEVDLSAARADVAAFNMMQDRATELGYHPLSCSSCPGSPPPSLVGDLVGGSAVARCHGCGEHVWLEPGTPQLMLRHAIANPRVLPPPPKFLRAVGDRRRKTGRRMS